MDLAARPPRPISSPSLVALGAMLLVAGAADLGCTPEPPPQKRTLGTDVSDTTNLVPLPDAKALAQAREAATADVKQLGSSVNAFTDAVWSGQFDAARTALAALRQSSSKDAAVREVLEQYESFLRSEESARQRFAEAAKFRDDPEMLAQIVADVENAFTNLQMRTLSWVINAPTALPAVKAQLVNEQAAKPIWLEFKGAEGDDRKAAALVRLLVQAPQSVLVPKAKATLQQLADAGTKAVGEEADAYRFADAQRRVQLWIDAVGSYEPYASRFAALQAELSKKAAQGPAPSPIDFAGPAVIEARERLRKGLVERLETMPGGPLRRYADLVLQRATGAPVKPGPMPLLRQVRYVAEKLYDAGQIADAHHLLLAYQLATRTRAASEFAAVQELRAQFRTRFINDVRAGRLQMSDGDFAFCEQNGLFLAGRRNRTTPILLASGGAGSVMFPDTTLRDFTFSGIVDFTRGGELSILAKTDGGGRSGLTVVLTPIFPAEETSLNVKESVGLRISVGVLEGPNAQKLPAPIETKSSSPRMQFDITVRGDRLTVRVNGTNVLSNYQAGDNFPALAGGVGLMMRGAHARMEVQSLRLKSLSNEIVGTPWEALTEATAEEISVEQQIEKARADLVANLIQARDKLATGPTESKQKAAILDEEITVYLQVQIDSVLSRSGSTLTKFLQDRGYHADALLVANAMAVDDAILRAEISKSLQTRPLIECAPWEATGGASTKFVVGSSASFNAPTVAFAPKMQLFDFDLRAKVRIVRGAKLVFLLKKAIEGETLDSYVGLAVVANRETVGRQEKLLFGTVEWVRQNQGNFSVNLAEKFDLAADVIDLLIHVEHDSVVLSINGDVVLRQENVLPSETGGGFGFAAVAGLDGKVDMRVFDASIMPLRTGR